MTTLIRPDNKQPAAYVTSRNGYICLRTDCITPSVMWFSDAAIDKANPVHTCAMPPRAIVVYMPLHLLENVKVKWSLNTKIIPVAPTLYHDAMNDSRNVTVIPAVAA